MKLPDYLFSEHEVTTGNYTTTRCCVDCLWFERPLTPAFIQAVRDVCPDCGGKIERTVGQYVVEHTRGCLLWFGGDTNIIAFKRKE